MVGSVYKLIIFFYKDELFVCEISYGEYYKFADYFDSFNCFIYEQFNQLVVFVVVVNCLKDLSWD